MPTRRQLAIIHTAKSRLGMTDEEYRDMLSVYGVHSSTELTQGQVDDMLARFRALGFSPVPGKTTYRKPPASKDALTRKIHAICAELHLTSAYVNGIARSMNFGVDNWTWCSAQQLHKIVAALTYHQRRMGGRNQ
jgi:phage gp16-like protein